jgi:GxxExxY protein
MVVDAALQLHRDLGPGLPESAYEAILSKMLEKRGLSVERQKPVPIQYQGVSLDEGFRLGLLVDGQLIVELKSVENIHPVHPKQLLTYLRLMNLPLGLLINFGASLLKNGLQRVANKHINFASSRLRVHQQRYHGVNLHNVWYRGTVEFRWFEATLHAGRIKAYLQFCLAVAAKALNGRAASSRKRDFDPQSAKYDFRVFLLHLGLIGDEFKTARKHLMANMPGDAAFKNGRPKPEDVLPDETTTTLTNEAGQVPGLTV